MQAEVKSAPVEVPYSSIRVHFDRMLRGQLTMACPKCRGNQPGLPAPKSDVRPQLTLVSASAWLAAHWLVNLPGVLSAKAA